MQMLHRRIEWLESRPSEEKHYPERALASSLFLVGRLDEARVLYEELLEGEPDNDLEKLAILAGLAAREGRREEVLRISRLVDSTPRPQEGRSQEGRWAMENDAWWRTTIAVALGDRERAMTLLREHVAYGGYPLRLHARYELEPLWNYPPFQELMRPKG